MIHAAGDDYHDRLIAEDLLASAHRYEPSITPAILDVAERHRGRLAMVEHRFKGMSRLAEKVRVLRESDTATGTRLLVDDVLRYTVVFGAEEYTDRTRRGLADLHDGGFAVVRLENTWRERCFRAITVVCVLAEMEATQTLEVQFHTPDSLGVRSANYDLYERVRRVTHEPRAHSKVDRAISAMARTASVIAAPEGLDVISRCVPSRPYEGS